MSSQLEYSILDGRVSVFYPLVSAKQAALYLVHTPESTDRKIIQLEATEKCHILGQLDPSRLHRSVAEENKTEALLGRWRTKPGLLPESCQPSSSTTAPNSQPWSQTLPPHDSSPAVTGGTCQDPWEELFPWHWERNPGHKEELV